MVRTARFVVQGVVPSQNKTSGHHWSTPDRYRQEFIVLGRMAVAKALRTGTWDGRPFDRARMTLRFVWARPANRRDPLNYAGSEGVKGLVDALHPQRRGELGPFPLLDDDFAHLEVLLVDGGVDRSDPRVEVLLEEIPPRPPP